jgi:hypothetical protein
VDGVGDAIHARTKWGTTHRTTAAASGPGGQGGGGLGAGMHAHTGTWTRRVRLPRGRTRSAGCGRGTTRRTSASPPAPRASGTPAARPRTHTSVIHNTSHPAYACCSLPQYMTAKWGNMDSHFRTLTFVHWHNNGQ